MCQFFPLSLPRYFAIFICKDIEKASFHDFLRAELKEIGNFLDRMKMIPTIFNFYTQ